MELVPSNSPQFCGQTLRKLGVGGFAEIDVIEQDGGKVARKRLAPSHKTWGNPEELAEYKKRFAREVELMTELTHPNIPTIFKSFEYAFEEGASSVPAYTMPLARESLQQCWHRNGGASSWQSNTIYYLSCMYQVAYTLAFIHAQDTIHRDLKPANILLFDDGTAMLSDFGASKNTNAEPDDQLTRTGLVICTEGFTAPEQLQSLEHARKHSDIYSFGATLFYLMTGDKPGGAEEKVHREKLQAVPPYLATFVCKCISFDPRDRYHDGTDLTLSLREILSKVTSELSIDTPPVPRSYLKSLTELVKLGKVEFILPLKDAYTQFAPIGITKFDELIGSDVARNAFAADSTTAEILLQMILDFNRKEYRKSKTWVNAENGAKLYRRLLKILKQNSLQISTDRLSEVEYELAESVLHSATINHRFEAGREFLRLFEPEVGIGEQTLQSILDSNPDGRKFLLSDVDYSYLSLPSKVKSVLDSD
ncbi:serine/threonine protein kinase [Corynebacterium guaraldiae]|uniref:serine/threonine protein kinase n=1 Tax=Corynebacterium guaraldiae TaxID=3051103 RepID=UPI0018A98329|nr:serine/threonine-protein kinase [Corynebacterium guaraldiae]